jgi:hypothetical protein
MKSSTHNSFKISVKYVKMDKISSEVRLGKGKVVHVL